MIVKLLATCPIHAKDRSDNFHSRLAISKRLIRQEAGRSPTVHKRSQYCCNDINGILGHFPSHQINSYFCSAVIVLSATVKLSERAILEEERTKQGLF